MSFEDLKSQGNDHFAKNEFAEAEDSYTKALNLIEENRVKLYTNRAAVRIATGNYDQALLDCDIAIRLDPKWTKAYFRKAAALEKLGRKAECVELWQEAKNHCESSPWLEKQLAAASRALKSSSVVSEPRDSESHESKSNDTAEDQIVTEERSHYGMDKAIESQHVEPIDVHIKSETEPQTVPQLESSSPAKPETPGIVWFQTKEEVKLRIAIPAGTTKKEVSVLFKTNGLTTANKVFLDLPSEVSKAMPRDVPESMAEKVREAISAKPDGAELYQLIDPIESTWTIERGSDDGSGVLDVLCITMIKTKPNQWPSLTKAFYCFLELRAPN